MRRFNLISSSAVMVALCTLLAGGCGGQPQNGDEQAPNDPQSGGLGSAPGEEQPAPGEEGGGNGNGNGNGGDSQGGAGKITICHIPPGNPANAHTITVGLPALRAHLKHGDTQGACGSDGGTGGGDVDAGTGGGDVDAGPGGGDAGTGGGDAGTGGGDVDAGTGGGDVAAGTGGGDVDAGPACAPVGSTCGGGVVCCEGLVCESSGYCEPIIG